MRSFNSVSKYLFISLLVLCLGAVNVSAEDVAAASGDTAVALGAESRAAGVFDNNGNNFDLENVRLNATVSKSGFDAVASVQYDGSDLNVLDASLGTALYKDLADVKVGRFLVPADRNASEDLYGLTTWDGTGVVSKWASPQDSGRGDGVAVSGSTGAEGVGLAYSVGLFDGGRGDALVAARVDLTVAKLEGLALGINIQSQNNAFRHGKDFFGVGVDALYTTTVEPGTVTLSASFADYDLDGARYTQGVGRNAGSGFSVGAALALANVQKVASLNVAFEPFFLYQSFDYDEYRSGDTERFDVGANFNLADFAGSKVTVQYFNEDPARGASNDGAIVGLQVVF
jgi:hypothetical protein